MFSIEVEQSGAAAGAEDCADMAIGRIVIGGFTETFAMPLGFWVISDYRSSWCRALAVLEGRLNSVSCLMVSMTEPEFTNFLFCWPLYRDGDTVYIQNSMIILDEVRSEFDPDQPWFSISPRCIVDDDGNRISEWATSMLSMREFVRIRCLDQASRRLD